MLTDTEYNRQMGQWSAAVQRLAKMRAAEFTKGKRHSITYKSGKKAGKTEQKLRSHVAYQLKSDSGEVAGVAFKFPVHGIFREYGVGNGAPVGHTSRSMSDWLSGTLNKKESNLLEIVGSHEGDLVVRTFMGVKK